MRVDEMLQYPGGDSVMKMFIANSIRYLQVAKDFGIQVSVEVNFAVHPNVTIRDTKIRKGIGGNCEEEALRVRNSMPKWKAGKLKGREVNVLLTVPVIFDLISNLEPKNFTPKTVSLKSPD
jgi:hypothetical protein